MKSLFLLGLVGLFSLGSVLEAEAGCRRRCGGHHRRGCGGGGGCYTQPSYTNGGCQVYGGGQVHGGGAGYVDPNVGAGAAVDAGVGAGAAADVNAVPGEPVPAK